jgi:hypothetical protein
MFMVSGGKRNHPYMAPNTAPTVAQNKPPGVPPAMAASKYFSYASFISFFRGLRRRLTTQCPTRIPNLVNTSFAAGRLRSNGYLAKLNIIDGCSHDMKKSAKNYMGFYDVFHAHFPMR